MYLQNLNMRSCKKACSVSQLNKIALRVFNKNNEQLHYCQVADPEEHSGIVIKKNKTSIANLFSLPNSYFVLNLFSKSFFICLDLTKI